MRLSSSVTKMKIPARQLKRTKTALRNLITERGSPPLAVG